MLPLVHPNRWRAAGIFILAAVMMLAMSPDVWHWGKSAGRHLISDKTVHAVTFALLTLWYTGQYRKGVYPGVGSGLILFGALIEACQSLVSYRSAEWGDLVADAVGVGAGLAVALIATGGWSLRLEQWLAKRLE